ncbi:hypothetical protein KIN20_007483 [Parelaphostrongylus tenuis]|uniref:Uncharacterized protein n=1 Tax=Parelaphostrongylus tenuis TaxID=148309 RepID=A0AAD5QJ78_PARTN|nr:hypothetical protein KIN20_007483 [Parelaphostrongylus tenuis]
MVNLSFHLHDELIHRTQTTLGSGGKRERHLSSSDGKEVGEEYFSVKTPEMNPEPPKVDRSTSGKLCKCFLDSEGERAKAPRPKKPGYTCLAYDWNQRYDGELVKKHGFGGRGRNLKGHLGIC